MLVIVHWNVKRVERVFMLVKQRDADVQRIERAVSVN